jgi:hypothetical protein
MPCTVINGARLAALKHNQERGRRMAKVKSTMNGQRYWYNEAETAIFVEIPRDLAASAGKCCCDYCKAHPKIKAKWDLMGIPLNKTNNFTTWSVHNPVRAGLHFPKR